MDWGAIKHIAYGPLNLNPQTLGELTYGEFLELHEGWKWREDRYEYRLATLASWITAPHVKKPITPEKFIGKKEKDKEKKKTTPEQSRAVVDELSHLLGVE